MRISDWSSDVCSSDLLLWGWLWGPAGLLLAVPLLAIAKILCDHIEPLAVVGEYLSSLPPGSGASRPAAEPRSEEHTSELQSLMRISYAVFCLKKKTKKLRDHHHKDSTQLHSP